MVGKRDTQSIIWSLEDFEMELGGEFTIDLGIFNPITRRIRYRAVYILRRTQHDSDFYSLSPSRRTLLNSVKCQLDDWIAGSIIVRFHTCPRMSIRVSGPANAAAVSPDGEYAGDC